MSHTELNLDERRRFYRLRDQNLPTTEIARVMGRHKSTLYREQRRNFWDCDEMPETTGYWPVTANDMAQERRSRQRKLIRHPDLRHEVIEKLKIGWSPEQISGRLKIEDVAPQMVSHETIYQYVYSKDGQSQELSRYLPERRKKRRPRHTRKPQNDVFPVAVSIKNRPDSINKREEFGHWEGDLMIFRRDQGNANVATIVERTSRYTVLFKNNDRRSKPIMDTLITRLSPLPQAARQSITFDRGFEFVSWRELDKGMGTKAWFCDPAAPWQKGSVENMNKRARRYLPRSIAVLSVSDQEMHRIADNLNATPRKCLGYRTPAEVFRESLRKLQ